MISRRSIMTGLVSLVAAPAIVRAGSLMPVKMMIEQPDFWLFNEAELVKSIAEMQRHLYLSGVAIAQMYQNKLIPVKDYEFYKSVK